MSKLRPAYVFVHGSCHGAWCWRDVIALLQAQGHTCRAIDLPPYDASRPTQVSLNDYAQSIVNDIDAQGGAPVILVGHSAGGYAITAAAALAPEKVAQLVYVCAYVPQTGLSLADLRRTAPRQPVMDVIEKTPDGLAFIFQADKARDALYHDCSDAVSADALTRLVAQPIAPQSAAVTKLERANGIPRHYVRCTLDRVIPPEEQIKMSRDWPETMVTDMTCGHSPFFAQPEKLARILAAMA